MNCTATLDETFADFLLSRRAKGLAEKTLESYSSQWKAVARHLDTGTDIAALQKADLDDMIVSMRDAGLSPNSINSYTRVLKSFFSWCNEQGLTRLNIPLYKAEETVKETYSDAELTALLKKPDIRKTTFAEYRDWVIINFLLNCGSRAATVRAIQIRDVDLDGGVVFYRHTKNRKAQVIPLCSPMIAILREYGRYRGGEPTDYLFCTETGTQLTENGLRQSIARYNMRRGVQKTSIHLFRHTHVELTAKNISWQKQEPQASKKWLDSLGVLLFYTRTEHYAGHCMVGFCNRFKLFGAFTVGKF